MVRLPTHHYTLLISDEPLLIVGELMKQIAVLAAKESWYLRDLQRAAAIVGCQIVPVSFKELAWSWLPAQRFPQAIQANPVDLLQMDAAIVRSMPQGSLEQIISRMNILSLLHEQVPIVNPPRALEIAIDKGLCTARLALAGLPVPQTLIAQTVEQALAFFDHISMGVVAKPLFGSEGRGLVLFHDRDIAERTLQLWVNAGAVLYLQEFIPHAGFDDRVLIVGDQCWSIRRSQQSDWRTNLSRGGQAETISLPTEWLNLAKAAAKTIGATVAGVDLLQRKNGEVVILEVNAVPGWRGLSAATGVDIAAQVLQFTMNQADSVTVD